MLPGERPGWDKLEDEARSRIGYGDPGGVVGGISGFCNVKMSLQYEGGLIYSIGEPMTRRQARSIRNNLLTIPPACASIWQVLHANQHMQATHSSDLSSVTCTNGSSQIMSDSEILAALSREIAG